MHLYAVGSICVREIQPNFEFYPTYVGTLLELNKYLKFCFFFFFVQIHRTNLITIDTQF